MNALTMFDKIEVTRKCGDDRWGGTTVWVANFSGPGGEVSLYANRHGDTPQDGSCFTRPMARLKGGDWEGDASSYSIAKSDEACNLIRTGATLHKWAFRAAKEKEKEREESGEKPCRGDVYVWEGAELAALLASFAESAALTYAEHCTKNMADGARAALCGDAGAIAALVRHNMAFCWPEAVHAMAGAEVERIAQLARLALTADDAAATC